MANKIKLARGTKSRIETIKETLTANELVYATDTKEIGVKNESGDISYFTTQSGIVKGTVATAAATAAKTTTIPNYTLKEGDLLAIKFTYGNTASAPSLNINGVGDILIKIGGQHPVGNLKNSVYVSSNGVILLYYDGTNFNITGSTNDTTYSTMTQSDLDTGTSTTGRLVSAKLLKDNINAMTNTTPSGIIKGSVVSATNAVVKTATILNYKLKEGDLLAIKFPNGNIAEDPLLNINGDGNIPIKIGGQRPMGNLKNSIYVSPNGVILLYYDGTNFNMTGSTNDTTYSKMTQGELEDGYETAGRVVSAKLLKDNINAMINTAIITTINGGF